MEPNVCFLSLTKRWEPLETCAKTLSSDEETLEEPPPTIKFHKRSYIPGLSGVPLLDKVTHETSTGCGLLVSAVTWYLGLLSNLLQSYLQVAMIYRRNPIQKTPLQVGIQSARESMTASRRGSHSKDMSALCFVVLGECQGLHGPLRHDFHVGFIKVAVCPKYSLACTCLTYYSENLCPFAGCLCLQT